MTTTGTRDGAALMPAAPAAAQLDCLLVHVPKFQTYYPPLNVYQSCNRMTMGLLALADLLDRNGYNTRLVHAGIERVLDKKWSFAAYLRAHRPKVVGFSLHFHHGLVDTFEFVRQARAALPDALIFLGGFTASFFAREILEMLPEADAVVRGDAEQPLLQLLEAAVRSGHRDFGAIPNVLWRRDAALVENEHSYVIDEDTLNDLVFTRFELMEHGGMYRDMPKAFMRTNLPSGLNRKLNRILNKDRSGIYWGLPVGRGCVFTCFYCGGGAKAQWRINRRKGAIFRKPEKVIETILALKRQGYRGCYISYDPQPMSQDFYVRLFRMMREQNIEFGIMFSAWRLASEEFLDAFAKLPGTGHAYLISPETGSDTLRKKARSDCFTTEQLLASVGYADKLGIKTRVYFSIGALEHSESEFQETIALEQELLRRFRHVEVEAFVIEAEPGAPWHLDPESYDITLHRKTLADFLRDHSDPTYSSMTSLGYTSAFFGDRDMAPAEFNRRMLELRCRYFCKQRMICTLMRGFWAVCRVLGIAPRPRRRTRGARA